MRHNPELGGNDETTEMELTMKWKATLPRSNPQKGNVFFVFATKHSSGSRGEMTGEISLTKAQLVWKLVNMSDEKIAEAITGTAFDMTPNTKLKDGQ